MASAEFAQGQSLPIKETAIPILTHQSGHPKSTDLPACIHAMIGYEIRSGFLFRGTNCEMQSGHFSQARLWPYISSLDDDEEKGQSPVLPEEA